MSILDYIRTYVGQSDSCVTKTAVLTMFDTAVIKLFQI